MSVVMSVIDVQNVGYFSNDVSNGTEKMSVMSVMLSVIDRQDTNKVSNDVSKEHTRCQ